MSKRGKRKSFGDSKRKAHDLHHLKKKKKEQLLALSAAPGGIKHLRVNY